MSLDEAMSHAAARERLDDYIDGALGAAERAALETHLALCAECTEEVATLRALVEAAGALPAGVAPARDLWPELAQQLGARTGARPLGPWHRRRSWLPALATAAAVTLLVAAAWLWGRAVRPPFQERASEVHEARYVPAMVLALERECAGAVKQLRSSVEQYDFPGGEAAAASFTQGLAVLDESILETMAALAQDPADPRLVKRLTLRYQQKLALLNGAVQLVEEV